MGANAPAHAAHLHDQRPRARESESPLGCSQTISEHAHHSWNATGRPRVVQRALPVCRRWAIPVVRDRSRRGLLAGRSPQWQLARICGLPGDGQAVDARPTQALFSGTLAQPSGRSLRVMKVAFVLVTALTAAATTAVGTVSAAGPAQVYIAKCSGASWLGVLLSRVGRCRRQPPLPVSACAVRVSGLAAIAAVIGSCLIAHRRRIGSLTGPTRTGSRRSRSCAGCG